MDLTFHVNFFFFFFFEEIRLTFHVNCLHSRQFTLNVTLFSQKKKKKRLPSAAYLLGTSQVNIIKDYTRPTLACVSAQLYQSCLFAIIFKD